MLNRIKPGSGKSGSSDLPHTLIEINDYLDWSLMVGSLGRDSYSL